MQQIAHESAKQKRIVRTDSQRHFAVFAWIVLAWNIAVILWGALVRATGSGAGCGGHWPLCNGEVMPSTTGIATAIEFTHRVMSGVALSAVLALFLWAWKAYGQKHPAKKWAAWSMFFICTEALIGAALVLLGQVAKDQSIGRVYSLSLHLMNTFALLASLALTARSARIESPIIRKRETSRTPFVAAMGGIVIVAIAGAITALGDTLFPGQSIASDFSSTANFLIRLRIIHPILAVAVGIYVVVLVMRQRSKTFSPLLIALVAVQTLVGAINVWMQAPFALQLIHLFLADCVWITLVLFTSERLHSVVVS